jgi:tRNA threonylcarbamoyladenosine biosynthesis protein TsaE
VDRGSWIDPVSGHPSSFSLHPSVSPVNRRQSSVVSRQSSPQLDDNAPMPSQTRYLSAESDTLALGAELAPHLEPGLVIYLSGELGAGKTTLARGILRGLGYDGRVKSPSFALVEPYLFSRLYLYHFDFYRFTDPRELGEAGFREYFNPDSVASWSGRKMQWAWCPRPT